MEVKLDNSVSPTAKNKAQASVHMNDKSIESWWPFVEKWKMAWKPSKNNGWLDRKLKECEAILSPDWLQGLVWKKPSGTSVCCLSKHSSKKMIWCEASSHTWRNPRIIMHYTVHFPRALDAPSCFLFEKYYKTAKHHITLAWLLRTAKHSFLSCDMWVMNLAPRFFLPPFFEKTLKQRPFSLWQMVVSEKNGSQVIICSEISVNVSILLERH